MTPLLLSLDLAYIGYKSLLVISVFGICLGAAAYSTWGERKVAAWLQDRVGPDRAGPFGLLQPLADGLKMIMKEEIIPGVSNKFLFILGPSLSIFTAIMSSAVIPWGPPLKLEDATYALQIADINVGVLYLLGVVSIGVYGIMIGGWASNNKYALLGALRASSQMISYEVAMGISVISLVLMSGTLSVGEIAAQQQGFWQHGWFGWNVFKNPLTFLIFFICALAETNRAPFDLPECETELVGGYHTEYSSMKLGFYLFSEYIAMFLSSAVIVTFFFGSYSVPGLARVVSNPVLLTVIGTAAFLVKTVIFVLIFMWIRWTIPRFRYDQLMNLGWNVLIPLSLANLVLTGLGVAISNGWFAAGAGQ